MSPSVRVLVVGGDGAAAAVGGLARPLTAATFHVMHAANHEEASGLVRRGGVDVCLVDCRDDMGGAIDFMRATTAATAMPMVALTDDPESGRRATEAGAADWLPASGLTSATLERSIRWVVERRWRRKIEARFGALIATSRELVSVLGADGSILYVSPSIQRILGFSPTDKTGAPAVLEVHPEDRAGVEYALRRVISGQETGVHTQYRVKHREGGWRVLDTIAGNYLADPHIRGVVVSSWDVTERTRDEEQIRFQANLLNAVGQAVIAADAAGNVTYWNHVAERLYGWSRDEALGRNVVELTTPVTGHDQAHLILAALQRGEAWTGEFELQRRDGSTFHGLVTNSPIRDQTGDLRGVIGTSSDISALLQTEADLRERVKELRTLYSASRVMNSGDVPLNDRLQQLVEALPAGWLYPEITEARLILDARTFTTSRFRETPWLQSTSISDAVSGVAGRLDIVLLEERPPRDEGPFLREERELLDALGGVVGEAVRHGRLARLHARTIASIDEAVLILSAHGGGRLIADVNPAAERMFGYDRAEMVGGTTEMLHVDRTTFERFGRECRGVLESEGVFRAGYAMRRRNGMVFDAEQTVTLLKPEQGAAGGVVSVIRDVSQRKRAEAGLRESEERFRQIAEHIGHVFWIRDAGSPGMDYVSPAYASVWGRSPEELYDDARGWMKYVLPSDRARIIAVGDSSESDGHELEYRIVRPDGEIRWILDRAFPVMDASGNLQRIIVVAEDITVRKQLEQQFGVLSQEISDVIHVVATDGTVLLSSPSVEAALGYTSAEFDGSDSFALVHADDRADVKARFAAIVAQPGATTQAQYRVVTRSGEVRHVESVIRNLIDHPAARGLLVTTRDVTERLHIEDRMRQAQKLEAIGRLAGGVAHDFNNILTVIRSQTELLLMDISSGPLAEEIEIIQTAAQRAAKLTAQLLAFSRDQVLRPEIVDLCDIVRGLDCIIERAVGERIDVAYDLPDALPPIAVDTGQLEQVIMNLAVNARDAMEDGGTLTLSAYAQQVAHAGTADAAPAALQTVLVVRDTGVGMSAEVRNRIFEPFFTTKSRDKGTGLGLAMVYGVVAQSGGSIRVESEPGTGTTFRIAFDAVHGEAARPAVGAAPAPLPDVAAGTNVLLVEDEPNVRRSTRAILERAGYCVHAVPDAESGLEALHSGRTFHVLLTDLGLPGMGGRELVERMHAAMPDLRLIVMSGYDVESPGDRVDLPRGVAFVPKPFTRHELLHAVGNARPRSEGGAPAATAPP